LPFFPRSLRERGGREASGEGYAFNEWGALRLPTTALLFADVQKVSKKTAARCAFAMILSANPELAK